jgi:phage FluMu protein Com
VSECKNCGAKIEYEAGSQSLKCPYCNIINTIQKPEDQLPTVVEKIIPMTVRLDDLEKNVHLYMASGDYTPEDMLEASTITKREFIYVPAYIFNVNYQANWTASFGYDRKEAYTAYRNVTRNGYQVREAYTAYKTVTDWQPHNGVDKGIFSASTYAGKLLYESDLSPADLVDNAIKNGSITEFNPSFMENVRAEEFRVTESDALESLDNEINAHIDDSVKRHAQGDDQRDWHWTAQMSHSTNTISVPICHAVFDYKGTEYHYWIDGIGSTDFFANKLPEDEKKKNEVKLGFIPVGIAIVCLAATSYFWTFTVTGLIITGILGGYAALRRYSIIDHSTKIRGALLTQMHASSINTKELSNEEQEKLASAFQRPEIPLFAKTHMDNILLPALSVVALLVMVVVSIMSR